MDPLDFLPITEVNNNVESDKKIWCISSGNSQDMNNKNYIEFV